MLTNLWILPVHRGWLGGWVWMEMGGSKLTEGGLGGLVWMDNVRYKLNKDGLAVVYFIDIPLVDRF